ncbi:alpha/beta fold hydrolase [Pseudomonas sp.]|jgi:pimeloyl-ACP methyl ester carboxylesterase|uniref:alpha/beta fold hydrolase n=1 Tax=Pseudomonas sp. TaxID=306 RepID=UPI00272AA668|nr:alpha/beta fold hydrolase [Pseudomonas sp.]
MNGASQEMRFKLPSMEIAAKVWGKAGGVPVIGLHGWLDNAATFDIIAPRLSGVQLVALDLPGHGFSDHLPTGGYSLWQQAATVLQVAEELGWSRFALLGHSMGAIISTILAGSLPERILGAAMIDGLLPITAEAEDSPQQMARFLKASLTVANKRKPVYASPEQAIAARVEGGNTPMTTEAARHLVERGLMPDHGGWTWRTDPQLMLPSAVRLTLGHAFAFAQAITSPACLVLANQGVMQRHPALFDRIEKLDNIRVHRVDGGHHLHLESQAPMVATILDSFYRTLA